MSRESFFERGVACLQGHDFHQANQIACEGLAENPDNGPLWQICGIAQWAGKDYEAARDALEQATILTPLFPMAQCALADCYRHLDLPESARVIYQHLAQQGNCPTDLMPRVASGLGALGEHELALQTCRTLVSLRPCHHAAHFGVAYYLGQMDRPPLVLLPWLRRAFHLAPHVDQYRLNFAFVLMVAGNLEESHELLKGWSIEKETSTFWLEQSLNVFELVGDEPRANRCQERLAFLGESATEEP